MSQARKINRAARKSGMELGVRPTTLKEEQARAIKYYGKFGDAAVAAVVACRLVGLRDLIVPLEDLDKTLPDRARVFFDRGFRADALSRRPICHEGGTGQRRCRKDAQRFHLTDSGFGCFYCEEHSDIRAVRIPIEERPVK